MSSVKIRKATIVDDLFLKVEYTEELPGHSKKDTKQKVTIPVHDDLKGAFQALHRHLAVLCDQVKQPKKADFEKTEFEGYTVVGFSITGAEENEGVIITGHRDGKFGDVSLSTPFIKWEDAGYPFFSELNSDVQAAVYEVDQYLFEGKRAPEQQLEMGFLTEAEFE